MSVVFGYIEKDSVYLASDNRITDTEGNFISDEDIKIEAVNNKTAVAFAGNYAAQNFFLECYKKRPGYQNWFVNDLVSNIWSMCDAITKMDRDWAKAISHSIACFLVAGKATDDGIKLFAITLKQGHIDYKEVPMMLFQPKDCDFKECANILCKNINIHPNDFAKRTIVEVSQISKLVSSTGNVWMYDNKKDKSEFIKI